MPPPENRPHEYPRPMLLSYTLSQEPFLPQDALDEIKKCIEYYRSEGGIDFKKNFNQTTTYMERLKKSLASKLPGRNHGTNSGYWDVIREMILPGSKDESTETFVYPQIGLSESLAQTPGVSSNNVFLAPINFKTDTTITSSITKQFNSQQQQQQPSTSTSLRDTMKKEHDDNKILLKDTRNNKIERNDMTIPTFRAGELTVSLKNPKIDYEHNNHIVDYTKFPNPLTIDTLNKIRSTLPHDFQIPDLSKQLTQLPDLSKLGNFSPTDLAKLSGFSLSELAKASSNAYARNIANLFAPLSKNAPLPPTKDNLLLNNKIDFSQNDMSVSFTPTLSSSLSSTSISIDKPRIDDNMLIDRKKIDYSCEKISKSSRPTDFTTAEELSISSVRPDFGAMLDMSHRHNIKQQTSSISEQGETLNLTKDRP